MFILVLARIILANEVNYLPIIFLLNCIYSQAAEWDSFILMTESSTWGF